MNDISERDIKTELNTPLEKNVEPTKFFSSPFSTKTSIFKKIDNDIFKKKDNNEEDDKEEELQTDNKVNEDFDQFENNFRKNFDITFQNDNESLNNDNQQKVFEPKELFVNSLTEYDTFKIDKTVISKSNFENDSANNNQINDPFTISVGDANSVNRVIKTVPNNTNKQEKFFLSKLNIQSIDQISEIKEKENFILVKKTQIYIK